jgi:hypothetical protein
MDAARVRVAAALLAGVAILAVIAPAAAAEDEGGVFLARPLDVQIIYPGDGTVTRADNLTAVIGADGESLGLFSDDFVNGTYVNALRDASGVFPNASAPMVESYYQSPEFELPVGHPGIEWSSTLEYLTANSSGNLSVLLNIQVRFGDRSAGRNWSAWVNATADGGFGDPVGPSNESLRSDPALQYRFGFADPTNASNPHLIQMEIWFLVHISSVEARLAAGAWTALGSTDGRYNFSVNLSAGLNVLEARVTDALGASRTATSNVTRDLIAPTVASAPQDGASIPGNEAAAIRFSEPVDRDSAVANFVVRADPGFKFDVVWSADNTTAFISAQESGKRGPVTVNVRPQLRDRAGNEFGQNVSYTYTMGLVPDRPADSTPLVLGILALVAVAGVVVFIMMGRAKRQRRELLDEVRRSDEQEGKGPPKEPR